MLNLFQYLLALYTCCLEIDPDPAQAGQDDKIELIQDLKLYRMISYLSGTIQNKSSNFAIVTVNGVGYRVYIYEAFLADFKSGDSAELYIHTHISETAQDLYGFRNLAELEFYELLLSISGVGPKSAMGVLSIASVDELKSAIASGDSSLLFKVSGIGQKTADLIVLKLRDKVLKLGGKTSYMTSQMTSHSADEIDALVGLGYSLQQAREALRTVDSAITDSSERIRQALRGIRSK